MSQSQQNLKQDIIKLIIDKLLIGLILVGVGVFSTNLVEKMKSERSFSAELNKTRVEKIGEVWEKVYLYQAASEEALDKLNEAFHYAPPFSPVVPNSENIKLSDNESKKMKEIVGPSQVVYLEVTNLINKNRFWLDEESYIEIKKYVEVSNEYLFYLQWGLNAPGGDEKKLKELEEKREKSRVSILKIRDRMLNE